MKQMLLDWGGLQPPQSLATFVVGRNGELTARLMDLSATLPSALGERFLFLWGAAGAGKSHLLKALSCRVDARLIDGRATPESLEHDPAIQLYLLDDCDSFSSAAQIAAFTLFNDCREHGSTLIAAAKAPPASLNVREDLRTRFGWGLVYQVHGLSDAEKIDALTRAAEARGFSVSPGVLPYLITHCQRDMRFLSGMLDALDRYSLETKRPITLPLLRELMQSTMI